MPFLLLPEGIMLAGQSSRPRRGLSQWVTFQDYTIQQRPLPSPLSLPKPLEQIRPHHDGLAPLTFVFRVVVHKACSVRPARSKRCLVSSDDPRTPRRSSGKPHLVPRSWRQLGALSYRRGAVARLASGRRGCEDVLLNIIVSCRSRERVVRWDGALARGWRREALFA